MSKQEAENRLRREAEDLEERIRLSRSADEYHALHEELSRKYELLNTFFVEPLEPSEYRWALH